ncbi:MAG: beta-phosphoglucomutase [Xanthomonadaceae bacterium]|nr:beta-phosphoglucomutase [Xanthomonadaceae bacterium]MDE1958791.1 beta-phosphoglucomutase [Xanthomonadaceae bacterium]MDE2178196.1 beta-phosphoglucomutase [Xanthomonadaceae bacterium]MDE2246478.1 beta-phosphoglucomutase [Xanthomonadaceae bacterium]
MLEHDMPAVARAADSSAPDPWCLVSEDTDPTRFEHAESLFALANGALGVRGGFEEGDSPSQGVFLASVWERTAIHYHERFPGFARGSDTRVPVADGTRIRLRLGDTPVVLSAGTWLALRRELDLRDGCYRRTLRWRAPGGVTLEIVAERIVMLDVPGLLAMRYRVRSIDYHGALSLDSSIDAAPGGAAQGDDPRIGARLDGGLRIVATGGDAQGAWIHEQTAHSDIHLVCAQRHRIDDASLCLGNGSRTAVGVTQTMTTLLTPGAEIVLEKYVAYAWSAPAGGPTASALREQAWATLAQAADQGYAQLRERQRRQLAELWEQADLAIAGAPDIEQALRLNLFHVFQSASRDGHGSAAAKGLTGEGYEGHYFWDAEAFMLPVLATLAPGLARSMLEYRYRTLDRARAHARELNHARGALYAWRTISGDECSAYFPSGSAQYHINAAVAWAIRLYVDASGDDAFLRDRGAEMLFETARIWLAIGHFNPRRDGAFCIHEVTGPDEYSALVDNNHYTNRMAQRHLRDAAMVAEWMTTSHPDAMATLVARIGLGAEEPQLWRRAAAAMHLPVDAALGIFPQDDTFLDKPRLDIPREVRVGQPLLLRLHPLTLYRHQVCKQADTLLALVLAGEDVDRAAKQRNLEYYEGVTVHDSTLSASTFAVLAAEVGQIDRACRYFRDTLRVDLDDLHGNTAHGVHLAAMAGSWLALTWGFAGLRVTRGELTLAPILPPAWQGYRFGLRWRGAQLRVEVDSHGVRYTLGAGAALTFRHDGGVRHLVTGQTLCLAHAAATAGASTARRFKAVIFDLDGVLADTAVLHRAAWHQLAQEIGVPFDEVIAERMKGVDRRGSLEILLERAQRPCSEDEKRELEERKNRDYRARIAQLGPESLLPGARAAVESARAAGLRVALASASRNAPLLLDRLGITGLFDYVVDAGAIARSKPDPALFLDAAAGLGLAPSDCLGVEDAAAGIAAIRAAGMTAIGIGDPVTLGGAAVVLPTIADFDVATFMNE